MIIKHFKKYKFMNEEYTLNNIENEQLTMNNEESDYKNLVTRLKEISSKIAFLEKTILD